jgi:predicted RND superfamily exporter protein
MKSLIFGFLIIAAAVFAILEKFGLGWGANVVDFLKGGVPVILIVIGIIAIFIGIADIKDRADAKKESQEKTD